jgi:hypothetical protein
MDKLRPGQIIGLAAAAAVVIFSFTGQAKGGDNLWSDFGIQTFPPILAAIVGIAIAVAAFGSGGLPERIGPLRTSQWLVVLALTGALIFLGVWQALEHAADLTSGLDGEESLKLSATFWLGLLSSVALLVGTVVDESASPSAATPGAAPSPF